MSNNRNESYPPVYVLLLRQDDPKKCTAAKLAKLKLAHRLYKMRQIPRRCITLNPFAPRILINSDRANALEHGLAVVDCSWERAQSVLTDLPGDGRRLPTLLASNPVNYAKQHKLSSVEALAAGLYIMGFRERAQRLLSIMKWGPNFLTLNQEPLEAYSSLKRQEEVLSAESQFF